MRQLGFSVAERQTKKVITKKEGFLAEMENALPWERLPGVIRPHYPKQGRGRQPHPMESMLRIYFLQQWYVLSDPAAEEALYDIPCLRDFAQLELGKTAIPDETSILRFRRLIETHALSESLFDEVNGYFKEQGFRVSQGTMVDATIINACGSTKNKGRQRDPDMHQTRKGKAWYFGMKIHLGTDVNHNSIHSASITAANIADIAELPHLLREDDKVIFADAGYTSDQYKRGCRAVGLHWKVNDKRKPKSNLSATQRKNNRKQSRIRARVEHVFRVIKCQFGYQKARYKGLKKNRAQVYTLLALCNIYMHWGALQG